MSGQAGANGILGCLIFREPPVWSILNVCEIGPGRDFQQCDPLIRASLERAAFDPRLLEETTNWTAQNGRNFALNAG